ncbi:hypothetical protein PICSAR132_01810 [Mycobacterium avium subsp. paratuberculosis]|nr:hypothetical protein PICSAR10_00909 [Mycobacterium avium subsp. paratuberculosis]CAG6894787.1 hypothetical protein PICSAR104_02301 [Mycobacterium avium subsp. paratuberculosis]CAG6896024.1 hypothetical protein PICSAR120_02410 [Mycobacterium avium subsp. paratuberculosis]CAG6898147.1 hypothetical protein PICSAR106_02513 [Mycobacterium avium subsp. paratuberculosis]CAG6899678.1 hypothetical protein PICSAR118_02637 [Mycobacterium avium subsp. paratuberculosis]
MARAPARLDDTRAENRCRSAISRCAARIRVAMPNPWSPASRQHSASRCQCSGRAELRDAAARPAATSAPSRARAATERSATATGPAVSPAATSNARTGCEPARSSPTSTSSAVSSARPSPAARRIRPWRRCRRPAVAATTAPASTLGRGSTARAAQPAPAATQPSPASRRADGRRLPDTATPSRRRGEGGPTTRATASSNAPATGPVMTASGFPAPAAAAGRPRSSPGRRATP